MAHDLVNAMHRYWQASMHSSALSQLKDFCTFQTMTVVTALKGTSRKRDAIHHAVNR